MKNFLVAAILFLSTLMVPAQPDKYGLALQTTPAISFETRPVSFNGATHEALTMLVAADADDYLKDLKKFLATSYNVEGRRSSGYVSHYNILVPQWSPDTLNLYYKTEKDGDFNRLILLAGTGQTFYSEPGNPGPLPGIQASLSKHLQGFYLRQYDEHIADQQKFYDRQLNDSKKLQRQSDKVSNSIVSHEESIRKANDQIRQVNSSIAQKENEVKTLNNTLDQDRKLVEISKKEIEAQEALVRSKERDYYDNSASGSLSTRENEKAIKDLDKQREKTEKLKLELIKSNEAVLRTESDILESQREGSALRARLDKVESDINRHESEISNAKNKLESLARDLRHNEGEISDARNMLESLKAARAGMVITE